MNAPNLPAQLFFYPSEPNTNRQSDGKHSCDCGQSRLFDKPYRNKSNRLIDLQPCDVLCLHSEDSNTTSRSCGFGGYFFRQYNMYQTLIELDGWQESQINKNLFQ